MPTVQPNIEVLQSSPFHSIASVTVFLSEEKGQLYAPDSKRPDELALLKPGFMELLSAAGMNEKSVETEEDPERVYKCQVEIEWTQPDGKVLVFPGTKVLDLSIGGSRWEKAKENALDWLLQAWGKENLPKRNEERWNDWKDRVRVHMEDTCPDELKRLERQAGFKAKREMDQKAQFGHELAETGAIERAVKGLLGMKSTYTRAEIAEGFTVFRSEYRFDMMAEVLGKQQAKALQTAFAAKALGVSVEDVKQLTGDTKETPPIPSFFDGEEDGDEFLSPPQKETLELARETMMNYHNWSSFNRSKANETSKWIFGKPFGELGNGEMKLLVTFYEKISASKAAGAEMPEIHEQMRHLREQIAQCVIEKRMWKDGEEADQSELPGMEEGDVVEGEVTNAE